MWLIHFNLVKGHAKYILPAARLDYSFLRRHDRVQMVVFKVWHTIKFYFEAILILKIDYLQKMTLFKKCLNDFCILWYFYLWINIILKNSIEPNIQFLCWGGLGSAWIRSTKPIAVQSFHGSLCFCYYWRMAVLFLA